MSFIGIDVSKKTLEVAALCEEGELQRQSFDNSVSGHEALVLWLKGMSAQKVVMEATGSYHQRLQQCLQTAELPVSVVNPAQVSYFVKSQQRRNKTDKADALMLAVYAKERSCPPTVLAQPVRQSLARELAALQKDLTRLKNRLEAVESGMSHPAVRTSLKRRIAALEQEKQALETQLEQETEQAQPQELGLLTGIPGIGVKSACLLLTEIGEIRRFSTAAKLVAFAGLSPVRFESGSSVRRQSAISRIGSSYLRRLLYMPSLVALRYNPLVKRFYQSLVARGKTKKAALVACMAKLLKIIYGVLSHGHPFDPNYATS